ncbi:MAG: hemerythrin domain-containing protein [Myxococcota bacterium]
MEPSEVRQKVLNDHQGLRGRLEGVERLARGVAEGESAQVEELRREATELLRVLTAHMSWEDSYLGPALREADAWGPERVARFDQDHVQQRREIEELLERLSDGRQPASPLARRVLEWIRDLYADMREEEAAFLDPNVLRDDVVGIDVETG